MDFEWDEKKNQSNIKKHGFSFQEGTVIFESNHIVFTAKGRHYAEKRLLALGNITLKSVIAVVYTLRRSQIRIISVRLASRKERNKFYATFQEKN